MRKDGQILSDSSLAALGTFLALVEEQILSTFEIQWACQLWFATQLSGIRQGLHTLDMWLQAGGDRERMGELVR